MATSPQQLLASNDTIAAIATPPGRGGVGIIRISGAKTTELGRTLLDFIPPPRHARYAKFLGPANSIIDQGIVLYFPAPHSFTGEDVIELQGHGGPIILDCLLQHILSLGARMARPGEFSERAFLNNKIDLTQAEAIADLIDSTSTYAARAAMRSLQGEFSARIQAFVTSLIQLRTYVEAAIDFPEEEIDFLSDGNIADKLENIITDFTHIQNAATQGALLREGMNIVIAGKPNAGKSSLLNALSGRDTAIVTETPGTTRDVLREHISINGMPVHIFDTAGLRESDDAIEQEGVRRAKRAIDTADCVLLVVDAKSTPLLPVVKYKQEIPAQLPSNIHIVVVRNKIDLTEEAADIVKEAENCIITLSAKTGEGIALLREHLAAVAGYSTYTEGNFSARRRHVDALTRAHAALLRGQEHLLINRAGELLAEELHQAQKILGEITGEFTTDDLLGEIFSSFCIGK